MSRKRSQGSRVGVAALLAAGLVLAGGTLIAGQAAASDWSWPRFFNVVTPTVGTANHSLAVAWAPEFTADTGVRVRVLPAPTGYARAEWLKTGEGRLSLYQPSDFFDQMDGVEGFASRTAGPVDTRLMNINLVTAWGYMVRGDSDIKAMSDIKSGTRVSYYPGSSFIVVGLDALLAYNGLSRGDMRLVEVGSFPANTRVVVEGRADVTFTSPIAGFSYEAEASPHGIRWLPLPPREDDPEAYDRFRALHSAYIPQETVSGASSAHGIRMDHAYQGNHVRADEDPEFVYRLLKWMDENHDRYKEKFVHARLMTIDNLVAFLDHGALVPLHEGAIKYLQEKGLWKPQHQTRQDQLVALAKQRVETFQAALDAAAEKGLMTVPGNAEWVKFWQEFKTERGITRSFGEEVLALPQS